MLEIPGRSFPVKTIYCNHIGKDNINTPNYLTKVSILGLMNSKRTGPSNRVEIQFCTFNHISLLNTFLKLFETLCQCFSMVNKYLDQI